MTKRTVSALALAAAVAGVADAAWYDDVTFKGDFRYRFQNDDKDAYNAGTAAVPAGTATTTVNGVTVNGTTATATAAVAAVAAVPANVTNSSRSRNRIRLRYGAYGKVNDSIDWGMRIATGGDGSIDSTNQSLSGSFGNKSISLDMAYVTFKNLANTDVTFGKMKNPMWGPQKSQLVWDGDVTPEGIAAQYSNGNFFANAGYLVPDSDSSGGSQEIGALQLGFMAGSFKAAAAYYKSSHDTANTTLTLLNGAEMFNIGAEYGFKLGSVKSVVFADYLSNSDDASTADQSNSWLVGFNFSGGAWSFGLAYMDIGDAGDSGLNDSDFNGGGADTEGFKVSAGYKFAKNASAGLTYFAWEDSVSSTVALAQTDSSTLQADLKFKF